ncbi:carboxypeptidase regulatory-like domain-containing protein [Microbacterium sp. P01]|uniref:carboxypeptidase regulatory-like domain-containing protein n=1 Tax=Microbacterium sp. P01 TaxID=3366261 RepID=UPI00366D532D
MRAQSLGGVLMSSVQHRKGSRLIGWLLAVLMVAGGCLSAAPANAVPAGSISGVITDTSGAVASGVQVVAYRYDAASGQWMWDASATTDTDGSYGLAGLADGDYRIQVGTAFGSTDLVPEWWDDAPDLWSATTITVSGDVAVAGISPVLATGASISGVVTDAQGAGIPGVSVQASNAVTGAFGGVALTDESGAYRATGLEAGDYVIQFVPLGGSGAFAGEWWDDATSRSNAALINLPAGGQQTGIDAVLSNAGVIAGTVTDTVGAPAPFTFVTLYRATSDGVGDYVDSRTTGPEGNYTFSVPAGDYKVQFSTSGAFLGEWFDDAPDAQSAAVVTVTGGATTTVDSQLTTGATVSGVATDDAGQPVANVTVWAYRVTDGVRGPGGGAATSADGSYSISGLEAGVYKIEFDTQNASSEVAGEWWDDAKTEQSATTLDLSAGEMATDISPRLAPAASISGTVVDGSGTPLNDVRVNVRDMASGEDVTGVYTRADGSFTARALDAGTYRIGFEQVRGDGSMLTEWWNNAVDAASADDIVLSAGGSVDSIDVVLSEDDSSVLETFSASLSGKVTDSSGEPVAGASVSVNGAVSGDSYQTRGDGTWSASGLRAGPYTVKFSAVIDGELVSTWWDGKADEASAARIALANGEQRTGIDALLGASPLPAPVPPPPVPQVPVPPASVPASALAATGAPDPLVPTGLGALLLLAGAALLTRRRRTRTT